MKVGMIGLGAMGWGMATNVAKAGYLSGVYNRTSNKAELFADKHSLTVYQKPAQLAAVVDVVLICVSADQDVLEIIKQISPTLKPGSVVVDLSTVSSDTAKHAAEILAAKQVEFLDAPVSGGVEGAKKGTLAIMVGGKQETLERVRPILDVMSQRITHLGSIGYGQATKAVNQIMAAGINQAVTEALAFAQAQNLPMEQVIEVISGGAAGNWFLQHRGLSMSQNSFQPGFKLALHHKDLKICQQMANNSQIDLPLVDKTLHDYEDLMQQGFGEEDISALFRLKKPNATAP